MRVIQQGRLNRCISIVNYGLQPYGFELFSGPITYHGAKHRITVSNGDQNFLHGALTAMMTVAIMLDNAFLQKGAMRERRRINPEFPGVTKMLIDSNAIVAGYCKPDRLLHRITII